MPANVRPHESWEDNFRTHLRERREALGISQSELARRIRERGPAFHQQTVARIESGDRPVRLGEAYLIAVELGVPLDDLVVSPEGAAYTQWMRQFRESADQLGQLVREFLGLQEIVAMMADRANLEGDERASAEEAIDATPLGIVQRVLAVYGHTPSNPPWDEMMRTHDLATLPRDSFVRRLIQARTAASPALRYAGAPSQRAGHGPFRQIRIDDGEHSEAPER